MQKNELFLLGVNGDNLVFLKKCYVQKKICYLRLCRELMQAKIGHCEERSDVAISKNINGDSHAHNVRSE